MGLTANNGWDAHTCFTSMETSPFTGALLRKVPQPSCSHRGGPVPAGQLQTRDQLMVLYPDGSAPPLWVNDLMPAKMYFSGEAEKMGEYTHKQTNKQNKHANKHTIRNREEGACS